MKLIITLFGVFYCNKADCNTGLLIVLIFGAMSMIPSEAFTKKAIIILFIFILVLNILVVFFSIQTKIPFIVNLIENILHRTTQLTGRSDIYSNISKIMSDNWALGWGITNERLTEISHLGNTQNGILQIIYNGGAISLATWLIVLIYIIRKLLEMEDMRVRRLLVSALAASFIADIVEIPFWSGEGNIVLMLILFYHFGQNRNLLRQCAENGIAIT